MNEKERESEALDEVAGGEDESIDSLMRAVAHVSTVDMPHRATDPAERTTAPPTLLEGQSALPKVGEVLGGRYELKEMLGAGGMGAVFAAHHRGTGREVAIKVLLPQGGSGKYRRERLQRFVREARAAGRIRHPNVVDVYDIEVESDPPYIVMERLHGESLWQRIKRGAMPPEEAVRVILAAMRGVAEVHRQGVVHRDLKPDNIYLARGADGGEPVPKVLDFGVSRIVVREGAEPRPTTLTRAGYILGTPSYMPLEQLRGEPEIDARADVYALGVILYEALCGARPFEARNDHELVIRMVTEAPTPLRVKAPSIDASLSRIVGKALARAASDRFQDVQSFASALEGWLAGERHAEEPLSAPEEPAEPATGQSKTLPAVQRRNATVRSVAVLVALSVAAGLWVLFVSRSDPAPRPVPEPKPGPTEVAPREASPVIPSIPAPVVDPPAMPAPAARSPDEVSPTTKSTSTPRPRQNRKSEADPEPVPSAPSSEDRATKLNPDEF